MQLLLFVTDNVCVYVSPNVMCLQIPGEKSIKIKKKQSIQSMGPHFHYQNAREKGGIISISLCLCDHWQAVT